MRNCAGVDSPAPFVRCIRRHCFWLPPGHFLQAHLRVSYHSTGRHALNFRGVIPIWNPQATTPLDPRVLDAMLPFMTDQYGNPHSRTHFFGWESEDAVEVARKEVRLGLATAVYCARMRPIRILASRTALLHEVHAACCAAYAVVRACENCAAAVVWVNVNGT